MPPPPGFPHPPPTGAAAAAANKNKAPKKPKALGSAFSRVPLIRSGIVPPSGGSGKDKDSPFSSAPLVRKGAGGREKENEGCSEEEDGENEEEKGHVPGQAPALAQSPAGGMYPPRAYAYGPPPPLPPHPNRPPPHARMPILRAHLPADAPPCGPEPVAFYGGKMYLRPEAHAHLTAADMRRLNALCVGEAFGHLLARSAGLRRAPFPPGPPVVAGSEEGVPAGGGGKGELGAAVGEAAG